MRVARVRAVGEEERGGLERARDSSRNREQEKEERWLSALAKPRKNRLVLSERFRDFLFEMFTVVVQIRIWTGGVDRVRIHLGLGIRIQISKGIIGTKKEKRRNYSILKSWMLSRLVQLL